MLDIVQDYMEMKKFSYERLDGSIRAEERFMSIKNFNQSPDVAFFLLSTRAGGTGLNLVTADTVIFLDIDFNPQNDLQAAARCHRIGQKRRVNIIRLICHGTVEQIILKRANAKLKLSEKVLGESDTKNASADELRAMIQCGLDELADCEDENGLNALEQIAGATDSDGQWSSHIITEKVDQIEEFEGVVYRKMKKSIEEVLGVDTIIVPNKRVKSSTQDIKKAKVKSEFEKQLLMIRRALRNAPRHSETIIKDPYPISDLEKEFDDAVVARDLEDSEDCKVEYVTGDVTKARVVSGEIAVVVLAIDDSGEFPRNSKLYSSVKRKFPNVEEVYEQAFYEDDLCLSDVHLIRSEASPQQYLALLVCQHCAASGSRVFKSVAFDLCLRTLAKAVSEWKCSLHFPRMMDSKDWYTIERMIKSRLDSLRVLIYYFPRQSRTSLVLDKIPDYFRGQKIWIEDNDPKLKRLATAYGAKVEEKLNATTDYIIGESDDDRTRSKDWFLKQIN